MAKICVSRGRHHHLGRVVCNSVRLVIALPATALAHRHRNVSIEPPAGRAANEISQNAGKRLLAGMLMVMLASANAVIALIGNVSSPSRGGRGSRADSTKATMPYGIHLLTSAYRNRNLICRAVRQSVRRRR